MQMPDHLSKKIQDFLRPVEGFRIKAGDKYKNKDCFIKIYSIRWDGPRSKMFIQGARIFEGEDEDVGNWSINGGWGAGFLVSVPAPKNKYCDHIYPYLNKDGTFGECFDGIELNKLNLI